MALNNKLKITDSVELVRIEEKISKKRAIELFESGYLDSLEAGKYNSLSDIHRYLFEDIYEFAGKIRDVNIAKGNFRFAPVMYLKASLEHIESMPQSSFDEIIEKYVEMNIAHPFREGNTRTTALFIEKYNPSCAFRITGDNFCVKKNVRYIPVYATFCLSEII